MDHYKLLGVSQKASKHEIKKAYHKLALKYHPDKNKASDAEDRFRPIKEAYEVLRDDHKRDAYDRFDLPFAEARNKSSKSHTNQHSSRHRRDERFFRGSSDTISEEQKYQDELARIRFENSELLDAANARLRRARKRHKQTSSEDTSVHRTGGNIFVGEIMPDKDDESYEKIVLDRLRALA